MTPKTTAAVEPAADQQPATPAPDPAEIPGTPEQQEQEAIEEGAGAEDQGPTFDTEAFVQSLPDGVCLCPMCIGLGAVVEDPPFDPHTHRCPDCLGHGRTRTGSLVSDQAERPCLTCEGRGFTVDAGGLPPATPAAPRHFAEPQVRVRDQRGRTPDDPEFDWSKVVEPAAPVEPASELAAAG